MYPEKKYNQTVFTCYDASEPSHFCQRGENWGVFTADECDWIISLSQNVATSQNYIAEVTNPSYRQVSAWEIYQTQETSRNNIQPLQYLLPCFLWLRVGVGFVE